MQKRQVPIMPIKGIQKDLAVNQFPNDSAYEIRNMRLVSTGDNTSLCLTNERGNSEELFINGTIIGVQVINNYAIIFAVSSSIDGTSSSCIYKVSLVDNKLEEELIYKGNLGFSVNNPIESIGIYETEEIQKVYWVDGIHQPRVINVSERGINKIKERGNDNTQFDFLPHISDSNNTEPNIHIEKVELSNGMFPAGVVQYAVSYFNLYGQQTGIIYESPLFYTAAQGRGLSAEDKSSDAFKIEISNINSSFEYVRIYRIIRTSIDSVVSASILGDYRIDADTITVTDTNTTGDFIDPTELLYLGGESIKASTITHKDNTLFLGNIELERHTFTNEEKENIKNNCIVEFVYDDTDLPDNIEDLNTQYWYENNLKKSSDKITFFQKGEEYRIGIQFLYKTGTWSEVVHIEDKVNDKRVVPNKYNDNIAQKPIVQVSLNIPEELKKDYIAARLVCVYPNINERNVLCQGLVLPTVYNLEDRLDNSPYVQSSWFARPNYYNNKYFNSYIQTGYSGNMAKWRMGYKGFPLEYRMIDSKIITLPSPDKYNAEVQYGNEYVSNSILPYQSSKTDSLSARVNNYNKYRNNFGIDKTIVTFHSPELDDAYDESTCNSLTDSVKFRIVGYVPLKTSLSDLTLQSENPFNPAVGDFYKNLIQDNSTETHLSGLSMVSFPFWVDSIAISENSYAPEQSKDDAGQTFYRCASFPIYPWHRQGSLNNQGNVSNSDNRKSLLKHKTMSNLRIGLATRFLEEDYNKLSISNIELFNSDHIEVKKLNLWGKEINYYGNVDRKLTIKEQQEQCLYAGGVTTSSSSTLSDEEINKLIVLNDNRNLGYYSYNIATYFNNSFGNPANMNKYSLDPLPIKYKSSSHAVFGFNKDEDKKYVLLPTFKFNTVNNDDDNENSVEKEPIIVTLNVTSSDGVPIVKYIPKGLPYSTGFLFLECTELDEGSKVYSGVTFAPKINNTKWKYKSITIYALKFGIPENGIDTDVHIFRLYPTEYFDIDFNNKTDYLDPFGYYTTINPGKYSNDANIDITVGNTSPIVSGGSKWRNWITRVDVELYNSENPNEYRTAVFNFSGEVGEACSPIEIEKGIQIIQEAVEDTPISDSSDTESYTNIDSSYNLVWENQSEEFVGFNQPVIETSLDESLIPYKNDLFYFIVGELYRDNVVNKFGGTTESALSSNIWLPCGPTKYFANNNRVDLIGNQGDTYYQRYDHLKTYPYTEEDINSVVDIASFCVETRINIDGRWDRNRGKQSNVTTRPTNFNLYNKVYSQRNSFFTAKYIDAERLLSYKFPTQLTWSKTKINGEDVDNWTHITLASILELDGDKGALNSLSRINNDIYAFQDKGISKIGYNERVQINASDGVPIEIANSNKVTGKVYISDKYGCKNKWSITETPSGLYFIDDINKCIFSLGTEGIIDLAYTKNMYSWLSSNTSLNEWNPEEFSSIRTLYDINNKDVYFTTDKEALAFNEKLGGFSSFYSYGKVGWMFNLEGNTYQVRDNTIWKLHGNTEYNKFFEETDHDYLVSIIANPEFQSDKIFDTLEFRTNGIEVFDKSWSTNEYPFNSLVTENEYQEAHSYTNNLKKKFRIWRWNIGRDIRSKRYNDRIRNPWAKITMSGNSNKEVRLYDMLLSYYS